MAQDKRREKKRLAFGVKVNVYRVDKDRSRLLDAYLLEAKNITQRGLFLRTTKSFPIGTELRLEIIVSPNKPAISAEGKVAWIAKRHHVGYFPGMGIEITKLKKGETRQLKSFLSEKFRNYRHAIELKKMYLQLKDMEARLYELVESHAHAAHFRKVINNAIREIDHIAHILDREVWEIKRL